MRCPWLNLGQVATFRGEVRCLPRMSTLVRVPGCAAFLVRAAWSAFPATKERTSRVAPVGDALCRPNHDRIGRIAGQSCFLLLSQGGGARLVPHISAPSGVDASAYAVCRRLNPWHLSTPFGHGAKRPATRRQRTARVLGNGLSTRLRTQSRRRLRSACCPS